ncbi:MAPK-activated protein kinase Srk1 [Strigomonas culicis]|uniref:Protein kinase n=1 Tax=Strigomonas culicis TaxID=28005 RepID=S9W5G0_9TRYP|nr:protein kinase [Strigomonas culicis]EPY34541.1 MAPK-activated protein kinase Srk1 [Strigomonas culicis]|eukprot:EPY24646.1 protein kinase [Strigomonas culicis]
MAAVTSENQYLRVPGGGPAAVRVPATPALEGIDIRTLYDVDHATLLGKGGFSEVLAATHLPTGERRALKVMQRSILTGKKGDMVTHEKEILRRTCHPDIVTLYETIQTPEKIYFALDLMHEDLFEFIVRNKQVNEGLTRKIMYHLLSAIHYLHEQSVIHRDIKPENILINLNYNPSAQDGARVSEEELAALLENVSSVNELDPACVDVEVKLADFGLAKLVMEWDVRSTPCGTSFYIAPEVIRGIESQGAKPLVTNQRLVKSVDVWSAGVVFFVLLSGRPPFHGQVKTGDERRALLRKIDHGVLFNSNHGWDAVSAEAKDVIARMLDQDVGARISAREALAHPFFTKHGFPHPVPGADPLARQREEQRRLREFQQQQQQQQANAGEDNGAATPTKKKKNFFVNVKHFFSGGSGSTGRRSKPVADAEDERRMHEAIAALQRDMIAAEDKEGDETAYTTNVVGGGGAGGGGGANSGNPRATMSTKAKIGPGALKK